MVKVKNRKPLARGVQRIGGRVCLFEKDWERVDALRQRVADAGLDDRISVRHVVAAVVAGGLKNCWRN